MEKKADTISEQELIKRITEDENSPLKEILEKSPPENDEEYIGQMLLLQDLNLNQKRYLDDYIRRFYWELSGSQRKINLRARMVDFINMEIMKKLSAMQFRPRLQMYADSFPEEDRSIVISFLLALIHKMQNGGYAFSTILKTFIEYRIPQRYLPRITEEHAFFADSVLMLDPFSRTGASIVDRDINFNSAAYYLFMGMELPEDELLSLSGSRLASIFQLEIPEHDQEDNTCINVTSAEDDKEFVDNDFSRIEDFIRNDEVKEVNPVVLLMGEDGIDIPSQGDETSELQPYSEELDYLYNEYLWIRELIKYQSILSSKFATDREKESLVGLKKSASLREANCRLRLRMSKEMGFTPRLEKFSVHFNLSALEKNIVKHLVLSKLFLDSEDDYQSYKSRVKDVLVIFEPDPVKRVRSRQVFLKTSRLLRNGIIKLEESNPFEDNIFECEISIDNRLLEYISGKNYDITDYITGSFLYKSSIRMDKVILPEEIKQKVLTSISNFPRFLKEKKRFDFDNIMEYGNSLVMLFTGPSGTGKTMLANGISNYLNKKILLFNLTSYETLNSYGSHDRIFSHLFREARMNDAIVFFDEAEVLLETRMHDLLLEIQKHEGIVIFATNASFRIDEAMRRRINLRVEFQEPSPALRSRIWKLHLPVNARLDDDVDIDQLAFRYELNGGLIRNAVFAALANAVNDSGEDDVLVTMNHLSNGAEEQLRNKLYMSGLQNIMIPQRGLDSMVLCGTTHEALKHIIMDQKAKRVLYGEWGFDEVYKEQEGVVSLFFGPSGTGKTMAAEAVAFETGKKIMVANYARIVSKYVGETEKSLEAIFTELLRDDSIILFDEADALFARRTTVSSSNDRFANIETDYLLSLIEKHKAHVILTTNFPDNIDPAFFRRITYKVEFRLPDEDTRLKLWKKLIPSKMPLARDVDLLSLARKFEFTGGDIRKAVYRAGIIAAIDFSGKRLVRHSDFLAACTEISAFSKQNGRKVGFK